MYYIFILISVCSVRIWTWPAWTWCRLWAVKEHTHLTVVD